ncbi:RHS repeat-associated protein [Nonomuraea muscovyensis]|uniref:RHS repeat-associated protein n=1 Tax=Nonomuraea muscovyensis TaxID=1124761 RepID=A0A7X0F1P3_9ACTN|nr:RHS repeat-associated core domain-containing protein [Nonomuraea muscovyensis]MBB6352248.1 RHS repeat-associated protein [Nonomuraea muscovyensis]
MTAYAPVFGMGRDPFGGLLGQQEGTNPALATLTDLHGDLVATYTSTALATSTAHDPFGTVTAQTGTKTNLGYRGEYTDPDTGKVNMHARWYQPGTGTFTSRDTATLTPNPSVQANRYTYANASPLTGIDPTGHYTVISGDAIGGIWESVYNPSRDPQEVAESYAKLGIISGGGGGASMCTYGKGCSATGDGGGIGYSDEVSACIACIQAGQSYWGVTVMTEEEMKRWGHLPNGWPTPPGFWELDEEARQDIIDLAYDGASPQMLNSLWRDMKKAVAVGGKSVSRQEIQRAMSQNAKLGWNLQKCHSHLNNKECRKLIEEEWEDWRKLFCGNNKYTTSCTATPVAKLVAKATDMPVKLFEFLGTQPPWITLAEFNHRAVSWARKHGATCNPQGVLVVCTGLKSGVHYGREATTIGNVVLTGERPGPAFLKHEAEHARQWDWYYQRTGFWPTFLVYYLDSSIIDACKNLYERQAEAVSKTYDCKK